MNAALHDPLALPMVSGLGKYATDRDGTTPDALTTITFHDVRALVDKPQKGLEKARAQWLIPSTHKSRKGHDKHGLRPLLCADVDAPILTIRQTGEQLRALLGDVDFEVYASYSATAEKQKCRILVPLAQALTPDQWQIVSEVFRVKLRQHGIETDPVSQAIGQVFYLPNRGKFYDKDHRRGFALFQPLEGWRDELLFRRQEVERQAEEGKQALEAARARREALASSRATSGFRSPIDAFNAAYDVADILTRYGYDQRGNTFRHPGSESGSYSATVRTGSDGLRRVNSLSTADPLHTEGRGAHTAFSAFCILGHGGDEKAAIRDVGDNWLTIGGESWNAVERREWAKKQAIEGATFPDLEDAPEAPRAALDSHPLAQFVAHAPETPAVQWLIPGLIEHGVVTISGARGVGKTTAVLPLAMAAAGLHAPSYALAPKHWRHVIYIVEHVAQAHRIISGMVRHGGLGIAMEDVEERLHLVEAKRLDPAKVAQVGSLYRERFARTVNGVEVLPLVVFDTKAAILALDSENDNSEASRAVAAMKQDFCGLPAWIVGHIAKASFGKTDVASLSDRGAGAFEADTIQNCYLVEDKGERLFLLGKRRFEPRWTELKVASHAAETLAIDEWGDVEHTVLRWGILTPTTDEARQQARAEAEKAGELKRREAMRNAILEAVEGAWQAGDPLSKNGTAEAVKGWRGIAIKREVEDLISDGLLHEVEVPKNERKARSKNRVLKVPEGLKKPEFPLGPEFEDENPEN